MLVEWGALVSADAVAAGAGELLFAGTNSVTVTSLPSAYFVVTVFAIIPGGTAAFAGGLEGIDAV